MAEVDDERAETLNAQISRAHVRLMREFTGRGPSKARTTIDGDLVVCILSELLTRGERRLSAHGKGDTVLEMRRAFQEAMRDDLVAEVARITACPVAAFMSANSLEPDFAAGIFVLERRFGGPAPGTPPARTTCREERTMGQNDQGSPLGTELPLTEDDVVQKIDEAGANQPVDEHQSSAERRETGDVEQQKEAFRDTLEQAAGRELDEDS